MKTFTYTSKYGETYEDCFFNVGRYAWNDNLSITIWNNEGPILRVTVNPDMKLTDDRIAIKDYAENEGILEWLISEGLIYKKLLFSVESGRVEIPVHKITKKFKKYLGI